MSDTSCMVAFRKAALLDVVLEIPYTFTMPDTLFNDKSLRLTADHKKLLCDRGFEIRILPGSTVIRVSAHFNRHRHLKLNDCFALALAEEIDGSILLTDEDPLRTVAKGNGFETRGVLWVLDELESRRIVSPSKILDALLLFRDDDVAFPTKNEVIRRIKRLEKLL